MENKPRRFFRAGSMAANGSQSVWLIIENCIPYKYGIVAGFLYVI
jgi:hypothetical protein